VNIYVKQFLQRGLAFGGFGPIIMGIVLLSLSCSLPDFTLTGTQVFLAILSTYILAFIQAGASIFNQIDGWSPARSILFHLGTIYAAYVGCYLINSWIPFKWDFILIFTAIFVAVYLVIWLSVYFSVKAVGKKLNKKL
jgi:hypothetical protein